MPDEVAPDVSTPASASTESSPVLTIPRDAESYSEWRISGKLPESKSKPKDAESAPAKQSAEAEEAEEKTAPAAEAGEEKQERQPRLRSDAAARLNELLADLKRAGLSPSELKSFKRETQQQTQAKPPETTAQPPAPPPQPPKELKEPKLEDFSSWDEFRKAEREYNRESNKQQIQAAIAEYVAQQQQIAAQQQAQQRIAEAKQRYGDEAETSIVSAARAVFNDAQIHPDIKYLVNQSPVMTDLLYVMGSNQADFDNWIQTVKTNPGEAIRRLVTVENLVIEELQKQQKASSNGQERDEEGKFTGKTPAKKISEAPPPARESSGRASPPPDEVAGAAQRGDVRAYINAANRRDLAIRQGR